MIKRETILKSALANENNRQKDFVEQQDKIYTEYTAKRTRILRRLKALDEDERQICIECTDLNRQLLK